MKNSYLPLVAVEYSIFYNLLAELLRFCEQKEEA